MYDISGLIFTAAGFSLGAVVMLSIQMMGDNTRANIVFAPAREDKQDRQLSTINSEYATERSFSTVA